MSNKGEVTRKNVALAAAKALRNKNSSKTAKSATGSALSQVRAPTRVSAQKAASAASKTLRNSGSSKSAKTSAGSALTQRTENSKA